MPLSESIPTALPVACCSLLNFKAGLCSCHYQNHRLASHWQLSEVYTCLPTLLGPPQCGSKLPIQSHLLALPFQGHYHTPKPIPLPEPVSVLAAQDFTHTKTFPLVYQKLTCPSGSISNVVNKKLLLLPLITVNTTLTPTQFVRYSLQSKDLSAFLISNLFQAPRR